MEKKDINTRLNELLKEKLDIITDELNSDDTIVINDVHYVMEDNSSLAGFAGVDSYNDFFTLTVRGYKKNAVVYNTEQENQENEAPRTPDFGS